MPAISAKPTLRLSTDLARVLAWLSPLAGDPPILHERDLEHYLAAMIDSGIVSIEGAHLDPGAGAQGFAEASLDAFIRACSLYLERLADDERSRERGRRFLLRSTATPARIPICFRFTR